jgi:CubicO group peptidase (beta-lactamase class C family)
VTTKRLSIFIFFWCLAAEVVTSPTTSAAIPGPQFNRDPGAVRAIVKDEAAKLGTKAIEFGMWVNQDEILTMALGESMTAMPAGKDMHFRIGGIAETFMSTLLLMLVEQRRVSLNKPNYSVRDGRMNFSPGSNQQYSHTDNVILGQFIERATGESIKDRYAEHLFGPLGMKDTHFPANQNIQDPNGWLVQNPAINGYSGAFGYKLSNGVTIMVEATRSQSATSSTAAFEILREVTEYVTPDSPINF